MAGSEQRHIFVTTPTPPASCKSSTCTIGLPTQSSIRAPSSTAVTTVTASAVHEDDVSRQQQQQQQQQQDEGDDYLGQPISKTASIDSDTHSVSTTFSISTSHSLSRIIARLRGQKSDKEFWMSDEQCKECYKCRKPFKLLRRRHHCRICGMYMHIGIYMLPTTHLPLLSFQDKSFVASVHLILSRVSFTTKREKFVYATFVSENITWEEMQVERQQ